MVKHFIDYLEYSACFLIALTHKKIALTIIVATNLRSLDESEQIMRIIVLLLSGIGVVTKIIIDLLTARKRKIILTKKNKTNEN